MWQRFTEKGRKVIFYAQEEAQRFGEGYVATEHMLLGIVRDSDSTAARVLDRLGVDLAKIKFEVEKQLPKGEPRNSPDMSLAPRAKRVIDLAYDEARRLDNNYIGTEHLLLGLIRESEGLAGRVLAKLRVDGDAARKVVSEIQAAGKAATDSTVHGVHSVEGIHANMPPQEELIYDLDGVVVDADEKVVALSHFSSAAKAAMGQAIATAVIQPAESVTAGHLAAAMTVNPGTDAHDLIAAFTADRDGLAGELVGMRARDAYLSISIPVSPTYRAAILKAAAERVRAKDPEAGTLHLLYGVLESGARLSILQLASQGVTVETVQAELERRREARWKEVR